MGVVETLDLEVHAYKGEGRHLWGRHFGHCREGCFQAHLCGKGKGVGALARGKLTYEMGRRTRLVGTPPGSVGVSSSMRVHLATHLKSIFVYYCRVCGQVATGGIFVRKAVTPPRKARVW